MKVYSILYMTIWNKVSEIPRGRVATYGQIARLIGLSNQARLIGYALHRLPASTAVPWYRVVNRKGKISLSESEGGYQLQVALLEAEGVRVEQGVIDLNKYQWCPHAISR